MFRLELDHASLQYLDIVGHGFIGLLEVTHAYVQHVLRFLAHQPLAGLDLQVEPQVLVDAAHALVIPFETLDVPQIQLTQAKAQLRWLSIGFISQLTTSAFSASSLRA
jgi:hypothetical protein